MITVHARQLYSTLDKVTRKAQLRGESQGSPSITSPFTCTGFVECAETPLRMTHVGGCRVLGIHHLPLTLFLSPLLSPKHPNSHPQNIHHVVSLQPASNFPALQALTSMPMTATFTLTLPSTVRTAVANRQSL